MALEQLQKQVARWRHNVNHQDSVVGDFKKRISLEVDSLLAFEWIEGEYGVQNKLYNGSPTYERFGLYLITKAIDVNSVKLPPFASASALMATNKKAAAAADHQDNDNKNNHSPLLDFSGDTLLHWACRCGKFLAVKLLLSMGADKNAVNDRGFKPQDVICTRVLYVHGIHYDVCKLKTYEDYELSTLLHVMKMSSSTKKGAAVVDKQTKEEQENEEAVYKKDKLRTYVSCQHHYYETYLLISLCFESDDEYMERFRSVIEAEEAAKAAKIQEERNAMLALKQANTKANKKQKLNP